TKLQAPSTKLQVSGKIQAPIGNRTKGIGVWCLRFFWSLGLGVWCLFLLPGCATRPPASPRSASYSPINALTTQRAVLTARGRQFAMNGYLATSDMGAMRLIVTGGFDQVWADLLVRPDGTVHVMRSSKMLRESWIRRFIAADLMCAVGFTESK